MSQIAVFTIFRSGDCKQAANGLHVMHVMQLQQQHDAGGDRCMSQPYIPAITYSRENNTGLRDSLIALSKNN